MWQSELMTASADRSMAQIEISDPHYLAQRSHLMSRMICLPPIRRTRDDQLTGRVPPASRKLSAAAVRAFFADPGLRHSAIAETA